MRIKIYLGHDRRSSRHPYYVKWYGSPDPDTGKQPVYHEHFRTEKEAQIFKQEKELAQAKDKNIDRPEAVTLERLCKDFLQLKRENPDIQPGTVMLYENTIDRLLSSDLFSRTIEIRQISKRVAEKFVNSIKPKNNGKARLSSSTRHRIIRHCTAIFAKAVRWGCIESNPFEGVDRPTVVCRDWYYMTPKEYHKLLSKVDDLQTKALYALTYTAGLRLAEATALLWTDVDLENAEVTVRNREGTADLPPFHVKDHETRRIPIPASTIELLTKLQAGRFRTPFVVVSASRYEKVMHKWANTRKSRKTWQNRDMLNNVLRAFKRYVKLAGIKPAPGQRLSIHDLRKSCITNWAMVNKNPKVTQVWAGHSDLKTTMQYYSKVTEDQRQAGMKALDKMLDVA